MEDVEKVPQDICGSQDSYCDFSVLVLVLHKISLPKHYLVKKIEVSSDEALCGHSSQLDTLS